MTTSAPASRAACATAKPILPELRLLMKRTGSIGSRVGPAVISTRRPCRSPLPHSMLERDDFERLEHAARADFPAGLVPRSGTEHMHAPLLHVATFARVAELAHI